MATRPVTGCVGEGRGGGRFREALVGMGGAAKPLTSTRSARPPYLRHCMHAQDGHGGRRGFFEQGVACFSAPLRVQNSSVLSRPIVFLTVTHLFFPSIPT